MTKPRANGTATYYEPNLRKPLPIDLDAIRDFIQGRTHVTTKRIAQTLGYGRHKVKDALAVMEAEGLIEVESRNSHRILYRVVG